MTTETLISFILVALVAEVLGTVGGFGSSLFFVPLAGFFFDFHSVLGITAIFHLASNLSKISLFRKGIDLNLVLKMGIPAVLLVIAGSLLSQYFSGYWLEMVLGVFLVGLSSLLLLFPRWGVRPTGANTIIGGAVSGFAAGLLGTGGAIRGLILSAFNLGKEMFVANSALIDLGIDLSRSIVYFSNGFIHRRDLYLVPFLILVSFVGTFLGKKILQRFSQVQFKYTVLLLILLVGVVMLVKIGWPQLFEIFAKN